MSDEVNELDRIDVGNCPCCGAFPVQHIATAGDATAFKFIRAEAVAGASDAAIDKRALATAQEIALMRGQNRTQFVARIQVALIEAMRWAIRSSVEAAPKVEVRLFDSQWVNIVNHANCYRDMDKEEAVALAVKLTEKAMRENAAKAPTSAAAPAPVDGMVLVPREPTQAMADAAVDAALHGAGGRPWFPFAWRAALAASPAAPAQPEGGEAVEDLRDDANEAIGWLDDDDQAQAMAADVIRRLLAALARPAPAQQAVTDGALRLDTDSQVFFYEQDFYVLSNFSSFNVIWKGRRFDTSEAAYHWEKFPDAPEVQAMIFAAPSAHEAFKRAERHRSERRADWDEIKVSVMREILQAKVDQHEYVRRKLLATGSRELIENSWRDDYWGWGPNRDGQNMLGKLWMEVRAALNTTAQEGSDA